MALNVKQKIISNHISRTAVAAHQVKVNALADKNINIDYLPESLLGIYNIGFKCDGNVKFLSANNYYFRAKIKRQEKAISFNVFLIKGGNEDTKNYVSELSNKQFLKTMNIEAKTETNSEYVDFECIFNPIVNKTQNLVVFELVRDINLTDVITASNFSFVELSIIPNLIDSNCLFPRILKMGIQAEPGTLMCINNAEIQVGYSGLYELRDGLLTIKDFGLITRPAEGTTQLNKPIFIDYVNEEKEDNTNE